MYSKPQFESDFIKAYGYRGLASIKNGQLTLPAVRHLDACYQTSKNSASNPLAILVVGRIVKRDGTGVAHGRHPRLPRLPRGVAPDGEQHSRSDIRSHRDGAGVVRRTRTSRKSGTLRLDELDRVHRRMRRRRGRR